jgi:triosephosphate isomerase
MTVGSSKDRNQLDIQLILEELHTVMCIGETSKERNKEKAQNRTH